MSSRRRYHAHLPGFVFTVATIFLGVGAFNSQNNLLFLFFGFAISSMVASGVISGAMLMRLRAERIGVTRGRVGGEVVMRYRVRNVGRRAPAFAVVVEELGEPAWRGVIGRSAGFIPHLKADGGEVIAVRYPAVARGIGELSAVELSSRFPFGFMRKSVLFETRAKVIVHPAVHELRDDALRGVASRERGEHVSERDRGVGGEFYSLREYVPGDAPSRVAWRASARHRSLLVREETRIGARAYDIVLNLTGQSEERAADERAITLAASIASWSLRAGAPVSVSVPGFGVEVPRDGSRGHLARVLDALAGIDLEAGSLGRRAPAEAIPGGTVVAVHASGIDPSGVPRGAVHLRGEDLDRLTVARGEAAS